MGKEGSLAWAKCGSTWLGVGSVALNPAFWLAQSRCREICLELGLPEQAELFEAASAELESVCVQYGKSRETNINVFGENDWDYGSRLFQGDPYIEALVHISNEHGGRLTSPSTFVRGMNLGHAKAKELLRSAPEGWDAPAMDVGIAARTKSGIKSTSTALPAAEASRLIQASRDLNAARQAASEAKAALKMLGKKVVDGELSERDGFDIEIAKHAMEALLEVKSTLSPMDKVEMSAPEKCFAPQKAYAAFLPGKGFCGSSSSICQGVDLGDAKLFESEKRAEAYFKRRGWDCAIVEVEVRVGAVKCWMGDERDAELESAAADAEASQMEKALDSAGIERLRERLAHLESQLGADEVKTAKAGRSRL